jgi:hypothetical protein
MNKLQKKGLNAILDLVYEAREIHSEYRAKVVKICTTEPDAQDKNMIIMNANNDVRFAKIVNEIKHWAEAMQEDK